VTKRVNVNVKLCLVPYVDRASDVQATVLIFPDLNTGNNTYKAVQQVQPLLVVNLLRSIISLGQLPQMVVISWVTISNLVKVHVLCC
jgi:hypothetical protein